MALFAPKSTSNFPKQPNLDPASYPGRVVQIMTMGLQPQGFDPAGNVKPPRQTLRVTYELVDAFMVDADGNDIPDKPRWVSEEFPFFDLSSDLAKSTKRYLAIDPQQKFKGDWSQLLGLPVMVTIINKTSKGVTYDNVGNLSPMRPRDAANLVELQNPTTMFDIHDPDLEVFTKLPKWLQEKMTSNLEFSGSALEKALNGGVTKARPQQPDPEPEDDAEVPADGDDAPW